jgi:hypothetical protein
LFFIMLASSPLIENTRWRKRLLLGSGKERRRAAGRAGPEYEEKNKEYCLFALNNDRPLRNLGHLNEFKGARGTKSKPIPGSHPVYGF